MMKHLNIYNLAKNTLVDLEKHEGAFILQTCQRTLIINYTETSKYMLFNEQNFSYFQGKDAYQFLLEVICGLQSKLVGENEIVGQFKTVFKEYLVSQSRNSNLLMILEKLFKDAKELRTNYLKGLCQKTYSSIARKKLVSLNVSKVLILGSGQLSVDLINQLKNKDIEIYISARNNQKVNELANEHNCNIIEWQNEQMYCNFPYIINTIGAEQTILDQSFIKDWENNHIHKLFIDLSSKESIKHEVLTEDSKMTLDDIFKASEFHENHKKDQIKKARFAMAELTQKRYIHLENKKINQMKYGGKLGRQQTI